MNEWYFNPVGGFGLTAAMALGLILLLVLAAAPRHRLSPSRRATLVGLRLSVILLALVAMLRPALVHSTTKKQLSTLVLLADRSRSMTIADSVGGKSRWELLQSCVEQALPTLRELAEDLEVKVYAFDSDLHPLEFTDGKLELGSVPDGQQTAIGAALAEVLRRESGKRIAGVILLSDGAQRAYAPHDLAPQEPTRRLADLGYPLYTLAFGQPRGFGQARDVALKDLSVNQTVYVKNDLSVHAAARIDGFGSQALGVQLLLETSPGKMEAVARGQIKTRQDGESIPVELHTIPQTPGEYKITLRADKQPGELLTTNNELSTFVTVLKGGINVLYVEGALRVEQTFLRRSLDASADIKVDYVGFNERDPRQRPADLIERFRRGRYDVYVIGDVDSTFFSPEELQALAQAVANGAGLVMLGGFHTFGPGGYSDTPLAPLLPVEMDPRERQRLGDPLRTDMHLAGSVKMQPARPLGERHYLMTLADDGSRAVSWDKLPPLDGANKLSAHKRSAQVLAESPQGNPLLVVQEAGGRVLTFAGDSTWHWWMEGFEAQHKRFWRQVVLWAAHKDEVADGRVWIKLPRRRFAPGDRVEFTAGAQSAHGDALRNARFEVEVILPDGGKRPLAVVRQADLVSAVFDSALAAGDYAIQVAAQDDRGPIGSAKSRFLVFEQDLELDNPAADPTLLASLAATTRQSGGQALAAEELPDLLRKIQQQPLQMEVETLVKHTPWDTWPFFLLFVGLVSTEWYLRKRWGLA